MEQDQIDFIRDYIQCIDTSPRDVAVSIRPMRHRTETHDELVDRVVLNINTKFYFSEDIKQKNPEQFKLAVSEEIRLKNIKELL